MKTMKAMFSSMTAMMTAFVLMLVFGSFALAQVASPIPDPAAPVSTQSLIDFVLGAFAHPVAGLALAAVIVQGLILFLRSDLFGNLFSNVSGAVRLLIVTALSLVAGTLTLMVSQNASLGSAILDSGNLAALMVFANQVYKQFFVKPA